MNRVSSFTPAIIWAAVVAWLSLLPGNDFPKWPFLDLIHADKWVHITMYLILSALIIIGAFRYKKVFPSPALQWTLASIATGYGILMEILQETLTTTRHFEWGDIAADAVGAALGILMIRYALKKKMFFTKA